MSPRTIWRRTVRSGSRGRISCSSRAIPSKPPFCLGAKRMPGCGECASSTRTEGSLLGLVLEKTLADRFVLEDLLACQALEFVREYQPAVRRMNVVVGLE